VRRHGERLGQYLHSGIEMAAADGGVLREAGDEEHLQAASDGAAGIGHLPPVHSAGQADIGDEQVDANAPLSWPATAGHPGDVCSSRRRKMLERTWLDK
jgi:hypothetical protein